MPNTRTRHHDQQMMDAVKQVGPIQYKEHRAEHMLKLLDGITGEVDPRQVAIERAYLLGKIGVEQYTDCMLELKRERETEGH